ncbi:VIN3-like protein 2 isoform X1 [Primulina tabacum]|uniref:VIN3-like protein 2 isoform X1 n=2 Tax=Primulina tabacum TaxID=48773 RepID=UPI003F5A7785
MDASSLEALGFDLSNCSKLSSEQKRELVYEMSNWTDTAPEMLQAWSRQEILQILCAELGKERKYTGLTKSKIIEHLLKIVHEKKLQEHGSAKVSEVQLSSENGERTPKRQRKADHPNRLVVAANISPTHALEINSGNTIYCKNSACKAKLRSEDSFCKRCSCCICHQYDDNKDPSLWLICSSDPPFHGLSCGMTCHLECALSHENSGISTGKRDKGLDGSFSCVSCGKVNDLLSSWRKQLVVAKETRRVDILCYRLSLSQKILAGTIRYQNLFGIIDEAVKKLGEDVGPLTGLPVKMARGIVNRLSTGPDIQRLCAFAVESLDSILSDRLSNMPSANLVRFEDFRTSSLAVILNSDNANSENVVGYTLWHRKANDTAYPVEPTCKLSVPNSRFLLSGLSPGTPYFLKVVTLGTDKEMGFDEFQFQTISSQDELRTVQKSLDVDRSLSPATNYSSLSNPSSVEDETCVGIPSSVENREDNCLPFCGNGDKSSSANLHGDSINSVGMYTKETTRDAVSLLDQDHGADKINSIPDSVASNLKNKELCNGHVQNGFNIPSGTGLEYVPYVDTSSEAGLPVTPSKLENVKDGTGRNNRLKTSDKNVDIKSTRDEEPQAGSSSKKRSGESGDEDGTGVGDKDFEYYVKVIRWLECDGHIETTFRQKFLTWYSLRATPQEIRIVKVFIDTFVEDPASLAGQLVDTFSDAVSNKRRSTVPTGFCLKLWH